MKQKGFARLFLVFVLLWFGVASGFAVQFQAKKADDFAGLKPILQKEPFWRKKAVWRSMAEERKIPVSVTRDSVWSFKGAGLVKVPAAFAVEQAKNFERLSKVPEHFPEIKFDPQKSSLHLKVNFLNQVRPLDLLLFEEKTESLVRIYFRSIRTWLPGLEGVVSFKDQGRQLTEVSILAQYPGEVPLIPGWLFRVSAEAVMHHVAERLRNDLERDYKN